MGVPWYAAWDLAFHCLPLAMVDAGFAKRQLLLMTREWYMHPSGQLPAYEWAFGDVNPPVHAWACWRVFQIDRKQRGDIGDIRFLERVFHKLMLNFTWWVNRKDSTATTCSKAVFSGWTTSGCSIAAAAADRRVHQPGRRHLVDGDVQPEPDAHRARARRTTTPTRTSRRSSSSTSSTSPTR